MKAQINSRDYMFDNLKGILIFLVVFGHCLTGYLDNPMVRALYYFVYSFHMPVFILIAGYFSKNAEKSRDTAFRSFFIPYFIINLLLIAQDYLQGSQKYFFSLNLLYPRWGMWFLLAMFVWKIMLNDLVKIRFSLVICIIIGLAAGFFPTLDSEFAMGRILAFSPFFISGYFLTKERIERMKRLSVWAVGGIFTFLVAISYFLSATELLPREMLYLRQGYVSSDLFLIQGVVGRAFIYLLAIIAFICLVNLCPKSKTFLSGVGQRTLTVYIGHLFILPAISVKLLEKIADPLLYLVVSLVISVVIVYLFSFKFVFNLYTKVFGFIDRVIFVK